MGSGVRFKFSSRLREGNLNGRRKHHRWRRENDPERIKEQILTTSEIRLTGKGIVPRIRWDTVALWLKCAITLAKKCSTARSSLLESRRTSTFGAREPLAREIHSHASQTNRSHQTRHEEEHSQESVRDRRRYGRRGALLRSAPRKFHRLQTRGHPARCGTLIIAAVGRPSRPAAAHDALDLD